jgi:hypothetical protein
MMGNNLNLLYLMGAGRSGTTAIATFLGGHPEIHTLGEMHQFYDHLRDSKACSCGQQLEFCPFWSKVIADLPQSIIQNSGEIQKLSDKLEYHSSIPKHFSGTISKSNLEKYNSFQEELISCISKHSSAEYFLDSAKYIGRNLSLRKSKRITIKTIYIVRDVRGVINSFSKNVQSSRKPLSTIFYYYLVNLTAMIASLFSPKGSVLKLKYEDFMDNPESSLNRIGYFLDLAMDPVVGKIRNNDAFEIGHIIGGNRLKHDESIRFNPDVNWKINIPRIQQILYYVLTAPLMLMNRYKI